MQIDVNFKEPFNGIIYANFDRTSPCTWQGDGKTSYHVELPLRGCGTKQVRLPPWVRLASNVPSAERLFTV